jgi:hypothetical protein
MSVLLELGTNIYLTTFMIGLLLGLVLEVARVLHANHARFMR